MSQTPGTRRRILLLAGQAFALGLTVAWTTIPASAIFLEDYGSGLLPITYIGAAAAGAVSTVLLGRAVRKRALAHVAVRLYALVTAVFVGSWLLLHSFDAGWVSFALLVVLPIAVPVGFMFIVGQAGMLLDVRTMKALYPRVIAGFALGFTLGGLAGPVLLSILGATEHLLLAAAVSSFAIVALVSVTRRQYPAELSALEQPDGVPSEGGPSGGGGDRVGLRDLLRNRFVVLIMAYQMLSAVESQWLDYLVYDRAGQRYTDSKELATFISRFLAIAYGTDIVILLLVAGFLLRRFGLRLGLTANPSVVLAIVAAVVIGGVAQGAGATLVFVLIVGARVSDLVLSDGTTRTSVSAAYQAIPKAERLAAQANVESLGVPLAIGFSGVGLIVLRATVGTDGLVLPVLTSIVLAAWIVTALSMYRGYRANLLLNLRRRLLDPEELALEGPNAMIAVDRLLDSEDPRDVRLGLTALTSIAPDDFADRLERLCMRERPVAFDTTLATLVRVDAKKAEVVARRRMGEPDPTVRTASLRTLASVGGPSDDDAIAAALHDSNADVRVAATAAVARIGTDAARAQLNQTVQDLVLSTDSADRVLAARMLGECQSCPAVDRGPLRTLMHDDDVEVRVAALDAVDWATDDDLVSDVVAALEDSATSGTALGSLIRSGSRCLGLADQALRADLALRGGLTVRDGQAHPENQADPDEQSLRVDHPVTRTALLQFVRACRSIGDPQAVEILRNHADHPDRDVGLAVLRASLHIVGEAANLPGSTGRADPANDPANAAVGRSTMREDVEHAARIVSTRKMFEGRESAEVLRSALNDEIALLRQRLLVALGLMYGRSAIERVTLQLSQTDPAEQALAMEWLDVTLSNDERAALALLEPGITDDEQWRRLYKAFPRPSMSLEEALRDLINDPDNVWRRPWLAACALVAATDFPELTLDLPLSGTRVHDHDNIIAETLAGLRRRIAAARTER